MSRNAEVIVLALDAHGIKVRSRTGLLAHLDCFGLWMIHDGKLVEVALPRTPQQTAQEFRDDRPAW